MKVAYHPCYQYQLPEGHRFPMVKYELLPEQLIREGVIKEEDFFVPTPLSDEQILSTHTAEYLDKLMSLPLPRKEERQIGFPVREDLIARGRVISGGTYQGARHILRHGGAAFNIAGGTHHAFADHGEGFCIFNDIAIASNLLLQNGEVTQILIIDLDVHQGNGTAKIFEEDDRVFTWSMHGANNYPIRKMLSNLDIGVPDQCAGDYYLDLLQEHLEPIVKGVAPDIIFYLAGVDILETDKLGRLALSKEDCKQRDLLVYEMAAISNTPIFTSMGGGYSKDLKDIINAHANTYRVAMDTFL